MTGRHHDCSCRDGTISVVLCLLVASCMVVFGIFFQGARIRSAEADLQRAVRMASEGALASYCGVLLQRYGIFALEEERTGVWPQRAKSFFETARPVAADDCRLEMTTLATLADRSLLEAAIAGFVADRLPAFLLALGLDRFTGLSRTGATATFDPLFDSTFSSGAEDDTWEKAISDLIAKGSGSSDPSIPPIDSSTDLAGAAQGLSACIAAIREVNFESAGDASAPHLPSPLEPAAQVGYLEAVLGGFATEVAGQAAGFAVDLYSVSMFRSRVMNGLENGGELPYRDLRGRELSSLATVDRYEVERIIAGRSDDEANLQSVERRILGLRMALNLLSECMDEKSKAKARTLGEGLSILLSAATAGAVSIPPSFLSAALQAAWAFNDAQRETRLLVEGKPVPFLPAPLASHLPEFANWKSTYGDHLTLLVLMVPKPVKLERIAGIIERNIALFGVAASGAGTAAPLSGFIVSLTASTVYRGTRVGFTSRYATYAPR